jgi:hypothetical protein
MTTVDILRENGNIIRCEAVLNDASEVNVTTRGETASLTVFEAKERFIVLSDTTVPSAETREATAVIIDEGATLTVDGSLNAGRVEIGDGTLNNNGTVTVTGITGGMDLLTYQPRAGGFTTQETLNSTVRFRERLPSSGDVTSLLVAVEPDNDLQSEDIPGIWGLIESVRDARRPALNAEQITVDIRVLAPLREYADHSAVRQALEV